MPEVEGSDEDDIQNDLADDLFDLFQEPLQQETNVPLMYDGSRCTVRNFVAKLQYFIAKHVLSDIAVGDLLELFKKVLPRPNRCPGTVYQLAKVTQEEFGTPRLDFRRICNDCFHDLGEDNKCHQQGCVSFNLSQQASYGYAKIGLRWQLKRILDGKLCFVYCLVI